MKTHLRRLGKLILEVVIIAVFIQLLGLTRFLFNTSSDLAWTLGISLVIVTIYAFGFVNIYLWRDTWENIKDFFSDF